MVADSPLVQILIRGGSVAIINKSVVTALITPPFPTTWAATPTIIDGTIQFVDQASGLVLSVPDTAVGTQAVVGESNCSWIVTEYSDDSGDDATRIIDPRQLTSGYYTLQEPRALAFLYRNRIEDYSLLPKRVALQDPDSEDSYELVIRVVG